MSESLGVGIVAYARPEGTRLALDSVLRYTPSDALVFVSVDDSPAGAEIVDYLESRGVGYRYNRPRRGSIGNDNDVWQALYEAGCEHIVMLEDDVEIASREFFKRLLRAVKVWRLDHVQMRCVWDLFPKDAGKHYETHAGWQDGVELHFSRCWANLNMGDWYHTRTEVTYLSRACIDVLGYMDTRLGPYSGPGHPDYLLRARRAGLYPWYWYISIPGLLETVNWETAGRTTTLTDDEMRQGDAKIRQIYRQRPIYVPYN